MRGPLGARRVALGAVAVLCAALLAAVVLPAGARAALAWSKPFAVNPNTSGLGVLGLACPSTKQCTLVDGQQGPGAFHPGVEMTFNPRSPGSPSPVTIDGPGDGFESSVACPSLTQCTTVSPSDEVTFNPQAPGSPVPVTVDGSGGMTSVACPTLTQCTAVDLDGQEVTFNPHAPGAVSKVTVDSGRLNSVACPSTTQCTAVGGGSGEPTSNEVTFNPHAPGAATQVPIANTTGIGIHSVACPTLSQCTAVGFGPDSKGAYFGLVATFNPRSPGSPAAAAMAPGNPDVAGGRNAVQVACPSASLCAAVDASGDVLLGNPTSANSFKRTPLPGYEEFTGSGVIACAAVAQCVAADWDDNAYVGARDSKVTIKIKGKKVRLKGRKAVVKLACPKSEASPPCAGKLSLKTAKKVPFHGHKGHVNLAKASFKVGAGKTGKVKLKLAKAKAKLVAHNHKARKAKATARVHDAAGNHATVHKTLKLK